MKKQSRPGFSRLRAALLFAFVFIFVLPTSGEARHKKSASVKATAAKAVPKTVVPQFSTDTEFPGVRFEIVAIQPIIQNRLMVVVRIVATKDAPQAGVLLGTPAVMPNNLSADEERDERASGRLNPKPFSLTGSTMTDEQSKISYPLLQAVAPPGRAYFPSATLASLRPGQLNILSMQFDCPPQPPAPSAGQKVETPTVSFLLPKAKGPISHVPYPLSPPEAQAAKTP